MRSSLSSLSLAAAAAAAAAAEGTAAAVGAPAVLLLDWRRTALPGNLAAVGGGRAVPVPSSPPLLLPPLTIGKQLSGGSGGFAIHCTGLLLGAEGVAASSCWRSCGSNRTALPRKGMSGTLTGAMQQSTELNRAFHAAPVQRSSAVSAAIKPPLAQESVDHSAEGREGLTPYGAAAFRSAVAVAALTPTTCAAESLCASEIQMLMSMHWSACMSRRLEKESLGPGFAGMVSAHSVASASFKILYGTLMIHSRSLWTV